MPIDRRGAVLVGGITAAVTLVALASRGDHGGGGAILSMSSSATSAWQTALVVTVFVLAVGVAVLVVMSLSFNKPELEGRRPHAWVRIVATALVFVAFALLMSHARPDRPKRVVDQGGESTSVTGEGARSDTERTDQPAWELGVAGLLVIAAVGVAVVLATRPRRGPTAPALGARAIATPEERDDAIARARSCADPREAVLLAFAAAEALLSADAATRRPPATSAREWSARVRMAPLATIVARYEVARFSDHAVTAADRTAALDALDLLAVLAAPEVPA